MNRKNLNKLIEDVLAIEAEEAKKAGALGYIGRALVQATLPHSKIIGNVFNRSNGFFKLSITTNLENGLPYGSIPRLLLAWMSTEATKTKSRHLILGHTLSSFMAKIDLVPKSGQWGTVARLKDQMKKLFAASISCTYDDGNHWAIQNIAPISKANLWWDPLDISRTKPFQSTVTLNEDFFNEIVNSPVPVDLRVLKSIARSPLAIDIYSWLTYRISYLRHKTSINWSLLQLQFGSGYPQTPQGLRNFKKAFIRELKKINLFCQGINVEVNQSQLVLKPSKPHISKL